MSSQPGPSSHPTTARRAALRATLGVALALGLAGAARAQAVDLCDGLDNDSDGVIDEGSQANRAVVQLTGGRIYTIDARTGAAQPFAGPFIGPSGSPFFQSANGLAGGADSRVLYALINSATIYALDLVATTAAPIADVGADGGCSGLALDDDGVLWCIQRATNRLVAIDPATGVVTPAPEVTGLDTASGGMAYSLDRDQLYMLNVQSGIAAHNGILTVDRVTGRAQVQYPFSVNATALAYDDEGDRFFVSGGSTGGIVTVDPTNGAFTTLTDAYTANNLSFFNTSDARVWFRDVDGDGFGDPGVSVTACVQGDGSPPAGYVSNSADSDDGDPGRCRDADGDGEDDCGGGVPDSDQDGVADDADNCPAQPNADQADVDGDGIGDLCDVCVSVADPGQADSDGDGIGDLCEDSDGDGVLDPADNCVDAANADQADSDGDGSGDACDDDDDDDGVPDAADNCPKTANADQGDGDGDGLGDACDGDADGDGVANDDDLCPGTPLGLAVDADGCSGAQFVARACAGERCATYTNNGRYVSCVSHASHDAEGAGLLTGPQRAALQREAARDGCR